MMKAERGLIAVIGAGPAGAMAAYLLAAKGKAVLMLDDDRPSPDRVEMLPPRASMAFRACGLGSVLDDPIIAAPCLGIIRHGVVEDRHDFISQPGGHGFAVHRPSFDAAIRTAAIASGACHLRGRLVAIEDDCDDLFTLRIAATDRSTRVGAQTIIDASGRAASAARRLGAKVTTLERLLAERFIHDEAPDPWLHFMGDTEGWRYTMTGPQGRRDAWRIAAPRHGQVRVDMVDASARRLTPTAGHRWIAIGDAACAFDPICCQGLAHATSSALAAAGMIVQGGTVLESAAYAYDVACRETAARTEIERRVVYAYMRRDREATV